MSTLRFGVCFFAMLLSVFLTAQTPEKWTLEKCIDYAIKNNIVVKQAEISAQISKNEALQSKLNLLPSLDANASYNFNFGNSLNPVSFSFVQSNSQSGSATLQGTLPLFTGLQQMYNIQRTKYELLASQFDYQAAQNNVALNVSSAFLQILLNKEIVEVLEKQKQLTQVQLTNVEARVKAGTLPENMLLDTEAQLARDEANLVNAKGLYDLSVLTLRQLLQLPAGEKFELDVPALDVETLKGTGESTAASIYDFAQGNQPSIKSADARIKSADASRKMAMGSFSPTIAGFTALSTGYFSRDQKAVKYDTIFGTPVPSEYASVPFGEQLGNNFRKVVGFQLNIPIFSKGQKFTNLANAKLQLKIRELQAQNTRNVLRQDIEQAYANANAAAESYFANKKSYLSARRAFELTENRYKAGVSNNLELQQSKNTLAAAESEMAKAKYTYVFRLKVLDFYQGKPITLNQ
ncbi:MAG: TolC family protein [Chitinophagales bacterium]|nr:TolC family protein [Chitinophagales bacterium]